MAVQGLDLRRGAAAVPPADFRALLKALHCLHHPWQLPQVIACTNSSIHVLGLFALAAPQQVWHTPPPPGPPAAGEALAAAEAGSAAAAASSAAGGTGAGVTSSELILAPVAPAAGGGIAATGAAASRAGAAVAGGSAAGWARNRHLMILALGYPAAPGTLRMPTK